MRSGLCFRRECVRGEKRECAVGVTHGDERDLVSTLLIVNDFLYRTRAARSHEHHGKCGRSGALATIDQDDFVSSSHPAYRGYRLDYDLQIGYHLV